MKEIADANIEDIFVTLDRDGKGERRRTAF